MIISILCGGSGTRLFPLSRELMPKQFASILPPSYKAKSLFQETLLRNTSLLDSYKPQIQVITNEALFFLAKDQAKEIGIHIDSFILESCGKNTAPALCMAAFYALESLRNNTRHKNSSDEIILALPSDHIIGEANYKACIEQAIKLAQKDYIVTFGITPKSPHTGYGYIKTDKLDSTKVLEFCEKPSKQRAQEFLQEGNYYWNSGMFCFKANVLLDGLKTYANDIFTSCQKLFGLSDYSESNCLRLEREASQNLKDESIDYALLEKAKNIACVVSDLHWSDVGSFEMLNEEYPKDEQNNASNTHFITKDCQNNFIFSNRPVIGIGLKDLILVDGGDCLFVSKKGESSKIKEMLPIIKKSYPELTKTHVTAYRPWGSYTILLESHFYKIKQIVVKPKSRLSLQKHFHRNEHWVIVSGSALIQIGEHQKLLKANQSTYIPMGEVHRLENPGKIPLVVIEIQMGEYLGEDDIVRFEDDYQRK